MSIDPFELLWDEQHVKDEIETVFGEFDEDRWNLDAGTEEAFEAHLESGEPIAEFYREEIGFVYQSGWNQTLNDERAKYLTIRQWALDNDVETALDYGCGIGTGVITLALTGMKKVTGADLCLPVLEFMKHRVKRLGLENVQIVDIGEKTIRAKFDMVVCTEVFEHVEEPVELAAKLDKRLKPGGIAIYSWSFVPMPTHLETHFDKGWQHSHPDRITTEGFGKIALIDQLGYEYRGNSWFNNHVWRKPTE